MEDVLGLLCFVVPMFFIAMLMWMDAVTHQYSYSTPKTAGDLRKNKTIMQSDIERKEENCPKCDGPTKFRMSLHGGIEQYLFFCKQCQIHFEYGYWSRFGDFRKHLVINATCPECKKNHKPEVIGDVDTDRIPCEPCWDKSQEPEPKTILIPPAKTWRERKRRSWNPWIV